MDKTIILHAYSVLTAREMHKNKIIDMNLISLPIDPNLQVTIEKINKHNNGLFVNYSSLAKEIFHVHVSHVTCLFMLMRTCLNYVSTRSLV
jgi:hypothetical protein